MIFTYFSFFRKINCKVGFRLLLSLLARGDISNTSYFLKTEFYFLQQDSAYKVKSLLEIFKEKQYSITLTFNSSIFFSLFLSLLCLSGVGIGKRSISLTGVKLPSLKEKTSVLLRLLLDLLLL